jgi:general secretion pathway protein D
MKAMVAGALISQSVIAPVIAQPRPGGAQPADAGDDIAKDSSTEINVKNAEIASIIRIFSRKLKRNYILDEKVRGKVSIYLPGKVSAEESLRILDSVLALKGFSSVPIGDNICKIVPSK